jgi:hypothetical protein
MFEATLQDSLGGKYGFDEAEKILDNEGETALKERFCDLQLAINVLKHGRGQSYDKLVAKVSQLPFRIKLPGEAFFCEGDVSEVLTLIEVDNAFVQNCVQVIHEVSAVVGRAHPDFIG